MSRPIFPIKKTKFIKNPNEKQFIIYATLGQFQKVSVYLDELKKEEQLKYASKNDSKVGYGDKIESR